ncbi:hypothetical protein BX285_4036 [Streptomyces sp. 1114.5]|uniref:hypothetical protein n=1 Tax=unclassified Streptomyces TaxID=2593676 RepID=UPI000BCDB13B|nr:MULTISPECIES: hypothetical protein [unclassified Streptomyces]RKT19569.1 hypothetical protein BX285_4036 [Streptomyces sp. 1114.5]SOB85764.1 hypothetical protein SAMN06272789_6065 [Streptomyces sp. 1331.2]
MNEDWAEASVELVDGYEVLGSDGWMVSSVPRALVAFQGGFVKLRIPDTGRVQVVSAPAVRLITLTKAW